MPASLTSEETAVRYVEFTGIVREIDETIRVLNGGKQTAEVLNALKVLTETRAMLECRPRGPCGNDMFLPVFPNEE